MSLGDGSIPSLPTNFLIMSTVKEKRFTSKVFNLKELSPNSSVWNDLYRLTVKGWAARKEFSYIRQGRYKNGSFSVLMVFDGRKAVAWGMRAVWDETFLPNLWLYTDPEYRNLGIQKNIVIPHWNKTGEKYIVYGGNSEQKATFKYVGKKQSAT